ncbi:hypothetical protein MKW94_003137 [Papaver nudicaule]|uniref:glucan endo-1,3-beta-D-glucosidase n=1 Tax=Papaver nudicaule TaxID=74823 RepID=A0AA41VNS9_PAPNU|nr:hypothetical protein [Papaver nudicaule]
MGLMLLLMLFAALPILSAGEGAFVGVNIGTAVSNIPEPKAAVQLLKVQQIHHVRLYHCDSKMLLALANTGIEVIVSVPNDQVVGIGQSKIIARNWISRCVALHYPATNITAIAVGSDILTVLPDAAPFLVSALEYLHSALVEFSMEQIKVSTPLPSSIILDSFPPSRAFFEHSWDPVLVPMLKFLQQTQSYVMLNVYPYFDYVQSNDVISLAYALFGPLPKNEEHVDSNTHLQYTNVFDAVIDAAYYAIGNLNITDVPIVVMESGWPSKGDASEPDANVNSANAYNSNLIRHVLSNAGTPNHPGVAVSTYIYELYNEDVRQGGSGSENWGLFDKNGVPTYILNLTASGSLLAHDAAKDLTFCIARDGADEKLLLAALDFACGQGKVNCSALVQGEPCHEPDTIAAHASYAFDAYYHENKMGPGTCDFKGVATITTTNPSHGTCIFGGNSRDGTGSMSPTSSGSKLQFGGAGAFLVTTIMLSF